MARQRQVRSIAATLALVVLAVAPLALADRSAKKPKKGTKPAASASASASAETAASAAPTPAPAPTPEPAPEPAPATSEKPKSDEKETKTEAAAEGEATASGDMTDTDEVPGKRYYFVGLRYRGVVIPQFLVNLFVDEGGTFYSNIIGAEIDIRKDHQSMIPWIAYQSFGFGDTLFHQKGQCTDPAGDTTFACANNYSDVNSGLGAIFLGLDELWSTPIASHLDFEYGFGVGIGVVFGSLKNDWVFGVPPQDPAGIIKDSQGNHYAPCSQQGDGPSCLVTAHQNTTIAKVNGYTEPNWFNGGSIPVFFPHIAVPQLSLRYKPIKQVEGRLSLGFSITGFFFGLSVDYGLEKTEEKEAPRKTSHVTRLHDTL